LVCSGIIGLERIVDLQGYYWFGVDCWFAGVIGLQGLLFCRGVIGLERRL
jgi:hypothetical protein